MRRLILLLSAALILVSCDSNSPQADPGQALVFFELDAPLCSSQLIIRLRIDTEFVATDTFRVNLSPSHTRSRGFPVDPGEHTLAAEIFDTLLWGDSLVTVNRGDSATRILPFYCS